MTLRPHAFLFVAGALVAAAGLAAAAPEAMTFVRHEVAAAPDVDFARLGDLDGDGDLDILVGEMAQNDIAWWENAAGDGTRFVEHEIERGYDGVHAVSPGDMDGDGDVDVVAASTARHRLGLWLNDGRGKFAVFSGFTPFVRGISFVETADVNDDGALDLLTVAEDGVSWWLSNGQPIPAFEPIPLPELAGPVGAVTRVAGADVDGDGHTDLITVNPAADRFDVWRQVPGGLLPAFERTPAAGYREPDVADIRFAGDLDRDTADDDLVALRARPSRALGWMGDGSGEFVRALVPLARAPGRGPWTALDAGDIDGDDVIDFVVAEVDGKLSWYENQSALATQGPPRATPPPATPNPALPHRAFLPATLADE